MSHRQSPTCPENKVCRRCKQLKPLTQFQPINSLRYAEIRHISDCDECRNRHDKVKRDAKSQTVGLTGILTVIQERNLWKRYRLTAKQFLDLWNGQSGRCAICKRELDNPYIDHCHATGRVRGILCTKCNCGLGQFNDSAELVLEAANYVSDFNIIDYFGLKETHA